jgi:predicted dehydrogenase
MQNLTRRDVMKSAAAGVTLLSARSARGFAANDAVNVGIIGVTGQGGINRKDLQKAGAVIAALCDVDRTRLAQAAKDHPGAKTYEDYRKLLEQEKGIDGVMISTPDHLHAHASLMAMQLGKGVDTEKPLTHSIHEARMLAQAARKYKVATQHDNEGHSLDAMRAQVEYLQAGTIGAVREVHIWCNRPIWPQGIKDRPPKKPAPEHVNWDLWIGPAPYRDFHDHLHPFQWRGWWDFGTGALGDMGCHLWDAAVWALRLAEAPSIIVEAEQEGNSDETGPTWSIVKYQFPARGDLPPVTVTWYDGKKLPPQPEEMSKGLPRQWGQIYVGEKGKILAEFDKFRIIPEEKMAATPAPKPTLPRSPGHKQEWLNAIRGGPPALSNFIDSGGPLAEIVLLGNLAIRTGEKIEWDPVNMKAKNNPKADRYVRREYRKGWEL